MIRTSQHLKYLEKYEEKENDVIFYLKDLPSSRLIGKKIARELFMFLFHDESLQLNRAHEIDALTYLIQKKQEYICLNCENPIFFEKDFNYITTCEFCNWRNELNDTPAINPIALKTAWVVDIFQICYPLLEEKDLDDIPEKLKEAVLIYFKDPDKFTKNHHDNIYHNLLRKEASKFDKLSKKFENKAKLARFFQLTLNINKEELNDCEDKENCDEFLAGDCNDSTKCSEYKKR